MKILVLNGGGSKGLASSLFLERFEREAGPIGSRFDLVCGVSTGAILGAWLADGRPALAASDHYTYMLPRVFPRAGWRVWRGLTCPRYPTHAIQNQLDLVWGEARLEELETRFMAHATRLSPQVSPRFWKSWKPDDAQTRVRDVLRASSAAPTYFAPHTIKDEVLVDGSLCTNEPSMCALAEAVKLSGVISNHAILTVRPGKTEGLSREKAARKTAPLGWLKDISGLMLDATERIAEYQSHALIGFANHVVSLEVSGDIDQHGPEFSKTCVGHADRAWELHRDAILERFAS